MQWGTMKQTSLFGVTDRNIGGTFCGATGRFLLSGRRILCYHLPLSRCSSVVEQGTHKPLVDGSSPSTGTHPSASRIPGWKPPRAHPVLRALRHALRDPAILAVSGGFDSTALALLAACVRTDDVPAPVIVWIDHAARPGSERDGDVVAETARRLALPFYPVTLDVATPPAGTSLEDWMRRRRLDALASVALQLGRTSVLTGHTRDDQAETILMRLLAGPVGRGWHGMAVERTHAVNDQQVTIHHPLLGVTRATVREWVGESGLQTVNDPTNVDTSFLRNRIRHDLLPVLDHIAPAWQTTLLRAAAQSAADADVVDAVAEHAQSFVVTSRGVDTIELSIASLSTLRTAVAVRVVRAAIAPLVLATGADVRDLSSERIGAVLRLIGAQTGKVVELPGALTAQRARTSIVVALPGRDAPGEETDEKRNGA